MSQAMSYVHKPNTSPLEYRTLFQLLDEQAADVPNKEAVIYRDEKGNRESLTFNQFKEQSQSLASCLLERGLVRGDRVLIMLPTCIEFVIVHMALNRIGANPIIVETAADDAVTELQAQIAFVICYPDENSASEVINAVSRALASDNIKGAIFVGSHVGYTLPDSNRVFTYENLLEKNKTDMTSLENAQAQVQFDDPAVIISTSGSTGRPKPIQYTHHGFINGACAAAHALNATHDTVLFHDGPFDWISGLGFGLALVPLLGMTLVFFPPNLAVKGHVTGAILKIIQEEQCTHAIFLSYFLHDLTTYKELSNLELNHLKFVMTGGQLTDRSMLKSVFHVLPGLVITISYGATEFFLTTKQDLTKSNIDCVDYGAMDISPGFELKAVDSEGKLVPVGTPGELYVRCAGMVQYCNALKLEGVDFKPTKTATGWYCTNDYVIIDNHGKLRILGRTDDVIKCATEMIRPAQIESVLSQHESVARVVAIGVPDKRFYEQVCACVILKPGFHGDQEVFTVELDEWCTDKFLMLSHGLSCKPTYYVLLEEYPKTRTGKTDRRALKKVAMEKLGL